MVKGNKRPVKKTEAYPYPSRHGSHSSMIKDALDNNKFLLKDEDGYYITESRHIDSGMMCPFRTMLPLNRELLITSLCVWHTVLECQDSKK